MNVRIENTYLCYSRAHCKTCRSVVDGREWRRRIAAMLVVPDNKVDFECPRGVPWGDAVEFTDEEIEEEKRRLAAGGCCGTPAN